MAVPMPPRAPTKKIIPEYLDIPKYGADLLKMVGVPENKGRLITGQWITTGVQTATSIVGQPLLSLLLNGIGGLFFTVGSLFDIFPDNTTALAVGNQMLAKVIDPTPEEMQKLVENIKDLSDAIKFLDVEKLKKALLRSPEEVKRFIESLGIKMPTTTKPLYAPVPPPETKPIPTVTKPKEEVKFR